MRNGPESIICQSPLDASLHSRKDVSFTEGKKGKRKGGGGFHLHTDMILNDKVGIDQCGSSRANTIY